ncbi:MAG TPA: DnaJ domain-containing protein [Chthonomonadaceae bacterium]|nr:DnaJ domain-containing protein [Chthonomonadaceae bacterium]
MSDAQPNYYEVLGLSSDAAPAEIKKRYRELARRYHPDVNASPDAARKITLINQAYHILGDVDRRAVYDAERLLRANAAAPPRTAAPSPSGGTRTPPRPPAPEAPAEFNGFGRTYPGDPPPPIYTPRRPTSGARPAAPERTVTQTLSEARLAYVNRRYHAAENLCQQILAVDRRSAAAHEILGDIFTCRGDWMRASTAYSYAIQFDPRNVEVQLKLDRLIGRNGAPASPGPTITRRHVSPWQQTRQRVSREALISVLSVALVVIFAGTLFLAGWLPGTPLVADFSPNLLVALALAGGSVGMLLAFYGFMHPISSELGMPLAGKNTDLPWKSLGALLAALSLLWFVMSLLAYLILGLARRRISFSVLRVYFATFLLSLLFAFLYRPEDLAAGSLQVAAFAGNFLFPLMLVGWGAGDALRLGDR